jgi:uncharacterized protein (DUF362 family)/ferredoxin
MTDIQPDAQVISCRGFREIREKLFQSLENVASLFPGNRDATILLKPNLNSNMNALTGNTTDLRILSALLQYLHDRGYRNLVIGEGTNSGFCRNDINVISRLRVDHLAARFNARVVDFNLSRPMPVSFENGETAGVAGECLEADLLINLPKLKTHAEAGMSACLKNLIGCLVGQENKKKTHQSLSRNILHLNRKIKPDLHIVDALISMEGLGPSRGTPVRTDTLFIGTDPLFLDLLLARFTGIEPGSVGPLAEALDQGMITGDLLARVRDFPMEPWKVPFRPPEPGPLAAFIHHPDRQKYFLAIRNSPLFDRLCGTEWFGRCLVTAGLRQDEYIREETAFAGLDLDPSRCTGCGLCRDFCPMDISLPEALTSGEMERCIHCLYCYLVCPETAVVFSGKHGFLAEQLRQYDSKVRNLFR